MDKPEVVISGISGRFPSADNLEEFEYNLYNKIEMVNIDDTRWPVGLFNLPERNGKIKSIEKFDGSFFDIPDQQINLIDPQERIFLELTYEALVDAGKSFVPWLNFGLTVLSLTRNQSGINERNQDRLLLGILFLRDSRRLR